MKNIFNGKRFLMLLKKEAYDLRNQYLKLMLIVACIFLIVFISLLFSDNEAPYTVYNGIRIPISNLLLLGGMLFAPFQLYKRYNHKIYGVNYFMLPASQTEKWLSMFFYCVIVTPVVLILSITLMDLFPYLFYPVAEKSLWFNNFKSSMTNSTRTLFDALITVFVFQSILFLGNVWFKRAKVQKTILAIIIFMIAFIVFSAILVKTSGINTSKMLMSNIYGLTNVIDDSQTWKIISKTIYYLVAPIGLWIVSFMKMREQQL